MKEVGLSYLLLHPSQIGVMLENPFFLLLIALGALFVWRSRGRLERTAAAFRMAALSFLALGLAGLALTTSLPAERSTLIAAVDLSESIDAQGREWSLRFLNEVARALPPGDELGVVTFAADPRVVRAPGPPQGLEDLPAPPARSATDIGRGLETSLALLPPGTAHRVLLISDGNETRGSARAHLGRALAENAPIFTVAPPHAGIVDVSVDKLAVAPVVVDGVVFPVRIVVRNSHGTRPGQLTFSVDGEVVGRETVVLQPGLNALEIPYRLSGEGSHLLRAEVDCPEDGLPGNNYREAAVTVTGHPHVLLLTAASNSPLAAALRRKDIDVEVRSPAAIPDAEGLLAYHCVVAENIDSADLPQSAPAALERYVRDFGGGLVLAGGQRTFGDRGLRDTPLARALPVTLEPQRQPPRERDPLALMVLIDRSNSMGYATRAREDQAVPQRDPNESKLHYAKVAALTVIRQLKDHDYVGVIAFDSQPFPITPLEPLAKGRQRLEELIPLLVESGGTDFYDALDSARQQLTDSPVARRHVILLTDGDTNRNPADHYPLISALAAAGISVTTIRIGEDVVNVSLLNDISSRTGGNFYHVEDVESLPRLMLRDTTAALAQTVSGEPEIRARAGTPSQILSGLGRDFPPLTGYAFSRAKPRADVPIYVAGRADREPILAAWQYGLGRVAAYTANPASDAERWVGWDGYGKLWSQVVRWAMREQTPWQFVFEAHRREGKTKLSVRSFDPDGGGVLFARVHVSEEDSIDLTLAPVGPERFEAELPDLPGGRYPVTVLRRRDTEELIQRTEMVSIPDTDEAPQEEFRTTQPNTALLRQLAAQSGGKFDPSTRDLVSRGSGTRQLTYRLDFILIPLAMGCFLVDVAIRRLGLVGTGGA